MKVYTTTAKFYNHTQVYSILLSDKGDTYMQTAFMINNTEEFEGHVAGIKRALSFVKNMKPLYAKNDMECIFDSQEKNFVQSKLENDLYVKRIKQELGININITEPKTSEDKQYLQYAKRQQELESYGIIARHGLEK